MRPVNLIPPEDRRGDQAPLRTGPLAYILIGGLVLVLAGVVALVLTGNQISESKDELATLKHEDAAAKAKAARLASYSQFQSLSQARLQTVSSLADSRFDWERVLRELALILPGDVHLTQLSASSGGEGSGGEGSGSEASFGGIVGPAMTMAGCAQGQDGVAAFVTALKGIDGVTRVGLQSSQVGGAEGGGAAGGQCPGTPGTATFSLVVAFDAAPVPAPEGEAEAPPESEPEAAQVASSETAEGSEGSSGEGSEGG
jgi:Tfp pilus assembly protein PilN